MAGRHHVLLIGIDSYYGSGALTGCVNDIDAVQRLLIDRVGVSRDCISRLAAPHSGVAHEMDIPEKPPTLANIRAEFARLGTETVGPEDSVFIYYSGHGTQCLVNDGTGQRFSREALLPRNEPGNVQQQFLFDWELNALLARIASRTPAVTVVLDCCSSAGATRESPGSSHQDRFRAVAGECRLEPNEDGPRDPARGLVGGAARVPRCLVVAACHDDERARESRGDGGRVHGELTRALLRQFDNLLLADLHDLRWGHIWRAVEAEVRQSNPRQNPWISGGFGRRVFGFDRDDGGDVGYAVTACEGRYRLDVGALAGVTEGAEVAVYGPSPAHFPPLDSTNDLAARTGVLRVVRGDRSRCEATAVAPFDLPAGARGRLCKTGRAAPLRVALAPHDDALAKRLEVSPLVELVEGDADLTLVRRADNGWALTDDVFGAGEVAGEPELATIPADRLVVACAVVEHYHAYLAPLRMARACGDLPNLLRLWLLDCNGRPVLAAEAQAPDLPQVKAGDRAPYELTVGDRVCFVVENGSDVALSVTLINCGASGRVTILGEKRIPPHSRHVYWFADVLGQPFAPILPEGRMLGVERVVAIATTRPDVSLRHLARGKSFADLIGPNRVYVWGEVAEPPAERWTSALTAVRVSRGPGTSALA